MDTDVRKALFAAMREANGLITVARAEELGLDRRALSRAVARGELERRRQRTYAHPAAACDWRTELAADLEACHAPAFAARSAALALSGLRYRALPVRRELVVVGSARPTVASDVVVHRTTGLELIDQTTVDGIRLTTVERALIDVVHLLTALQRLELVDDAIMGDFADRALLFARASELRNGRKGVGTIVQATAPGAENRFRSRLEKLGMALLVEAGVVDMKVNVVPRRAPLAGVTDVVSETDRLIVDWDGLRFHSGRAARQRDNDKANQAAIGGYTALRFTYRDVLARGSYVISTAERARAVR